MAFNDPVPVRRIQAATGESVWLEVDDAATADAWLLSWGAHGKGWFHAIVDSEAEAQEMIDKLSFIG